MTAQTPATAEMEKWLRVRFFTNFWWPVRFRVRKKNAESCRNWIQYSGSGPTSASTQIRDRFQTFFFLSTNSQV